jgi:hypothetical protein
MQQGYRVVTFSENGQELPAEEDKQDWCGICVQEQHHIVARNRQFSKKAIRDYLNQYKKD